MVKFGMENPGDFVESWSVLIVETVERNLSIQICEFFQNSSGYEKV